MKKIISTLLVIMFMAVMTLGVTGCVAQDTDGKWHIALTKEAADAIEKGAETGTSILSLLSLFVPGLAGVAGAAAAGTATYKKMKPSLVKNKAVSKHVVKSLQTVKETNPEMWGYLKDYMKKDCNADMDAAINEIVDLIKIAERKEGKS